MDDAALLQAALEGLQLQKQRIEAQIREVRSRLGKKRSSARPAKAVASSSRGRQRLSAEARKRIAAAQKKRWEAFRRKSTPKKSAPKRITDIP